MIGGSQTRSGACVPGEYCPLQALMPLKMPEWTEPVRRSLVVRHARRCILQAHVDHSGIGAYCPAVLPHLSGAYASAHSLVSAVSITVQSAGDGITRLLRLGATALVRAVRCLVAAGAVA